MYAEYKLICLYCNHKYTFSPSTYRPTPKCPICKDTHAREAPDASTKDVFGYGSDAPKKDAYIATPDRDKDESSYD